MPTNNGIFKEDEMVHYLDNKKVKELSNNLRNVVTALFGVLDEEEVVHCQKTDDFIKPDFCIEYRGKKKYVSMKSGRAETVHQELIKNFVLFLREKGISKRTQQTLLLYQYGDGTMDGSAEKRIEYNRLRALLEDRIKDANEEMNQNKDFIWEVMEHCLILGTLQNAIAIDAVYFGDVRFGVVATAKQIKKHVYRKDWRWMNNLHIGPIQLRPHARYYGKEVKNPHAREKLECYWANFGSDMDFISSRYDY